MTAQDSSSLHRSNTPLLNNFNRSDLNDNKKDYHMVKPDSEDTSKAVSIVEFIIFYIDFVLRCNVK